MAPYRIVPAFYPLEDGHGNLGASCPDSGVEKFQLHRAPERFDQRVVVAVPDRAHGRYESGVEQAPSEGPRGELAAVVGM